ncbi:M1 family metallopeptidase [Nocardioides sp.]|uniref:M1 family metallopeptidase n=1 Tax=Nocardioides sp. TaxID=35761 RepID=UPI00262E1DB9|nr:M1 family metallopeptidase [Nocardioides sp.]MDI6909065.1 M1 family metallopeptidase [Nocardioides sp.]
MLARRIAALTAAAALVGSSAASAPALGRAEAPPGAAGIGDPYFPLDGNGGIDVLRYDIHDRYRFGDRHLSGWTVVTLRATESLSSFNLDLLLPVRSVSVDGRDAGFEKSPHELVVKHPVDTGETVRVVVRYAGRPSAYSYAGESNWLASDHEVVAMNQPHMAPWWFPSNDHPLDRAHVRMSITVPKESQVIGNGRRVDREVRGGLATTTWEAREPMVPYLAFFAAGRFEIARGRLDGRPWYAAVSKLLSPAQRQVAMGLMERTPRLLRWLERQVGDYPFSTTGGLTTALPVGFALENQTRPTYPWMGDGPGAVSIVVHELAHQWFGDSVAVEGWTDIWLNEGWATYFEQYYAETHGGPTTDAWLREEYGTSSADDPFWGHQVADPCPGHEDCVSWIFAPFVYERGGLALAALRNRVGDADFATLTGRWVSEHAGGTGSTAQFQALAEQVSGQDLGGLFDAWVRSTTKPEDTAANGLG